MAVSANTVWEIRSTATASNANGGGFVTGASGVDYSQQDAAQYALTGVTSSGAGDTFLTASAAVDMVGNICKVISGTNFTTGWYEIIAVSAGVSVQVDRAVTTGVGANGVINIGGALSNLEDAVLENATSGGGNIFYIRAASGGTTYTPPGLISTSASGGSLKPHFVIGYTGSRSSGANGNDRPTIAMAGNTCNSGVSWVWKNIKFTTTAAGGIGAFANNQFINCDVVNSSGTAGRFGFTASSGDVLFMQCSASSTNGIALNVAGNTAHLIGCYTYDSDKGIRDTTASNTVIEDCIVDNCVTAAIHLNVGTRINSYLIKNCTLYGASTPAGTGVLIDTGGAADLRIINTIISGFVTGVNHADAQSIGVDAYNCYYNNTTNASNWTLGTGTITTDPAFTNAASGDFSTGTNVQRVGFPGTLASSTSYNDIGAVRSNYTAWYTDVDTAKVLTTQGNYKYNSTSNNRTPTAIASSGGGQKNKVMGGFY